MTDHPEKILNDIAADHYFRNKRKRWHRPKLYRYQVATPGLRFGLNRYPHHIIGAGVIIGRYAYSVKWAAL